MVFGWAQILMDIQPLVAMITGVGKLHGFSHTYLGATLIAVLAAFSGKYLSELGLLLIGISKRANPITITWLVVVISAFIGTFSHVFLDSIMHSDVAPFFPLQLENKLWGIISVGQLHTLCLYTGMVGAGLYYILQFWSKTKK